MYNTVCLVPLSVARSVVYLGQGNVVRQVMYDLVS